MISPAQAGATNPVNIRSGDCLDENSNKSIHSNNSNNKNNSNSNYSKKNSSNHTHQTSTLADKFSGGGPTVGCTSEATLRVQAPSFLESRPQSPRDLGSRFRSPGETPWHTPEPRPPSWIQHQHQQHNLLQQQQQQQHEPLLASAWHPLNLNRFQHSRELLSSPRFDLTSAYLPGMTGGVLPPHMLDRYPSLLTPFHPLLPAPAGPDIQHSLFPSPTPLDKHHPLFPSPSALDNPLFPSPTPSDKQPSFFPSPTPSDRQPPSPKPPDQHKRKRSLSFEPRTDPLEHIEWSVDQRGLGDRTPAASEGQARQSPQENKRSPTNQSLKARILDRSPETGVPDWRQTSSSTHPQISSNQPKLSSNQPQPKPPTTQTPSSSNKPSPAPLNGSTNNNNSGYINSPGQTIPSGHPGNNGQVKSENPGHQDQAKGGNPVNQDQVKGGTPGQPGNPAHFNYGSLIQLADGTMKKVEELKTEDFLASAQSSPDVKIDKSRVVRMEPLETSGSVLITFSVGRHQVQVRVEAAPEHPFYVFNQGWSSCNPNLTLARYQLPAKPLNLGDVCISLTHKASDCPSLLMPPPPQGETTCSQGDVRQSSIMQGETPCSQGDSRESSTLQRETTCSQGDSKQPPVLQGEDRKSSVENKDINMYSFDSRDLRQSPVDIRDYKKSQLDPRDPRYSPLFIRDHRLSPMNIRDLRKSPLDPRQCPLDDRDHQSPSDALKFTLDPTGPKKSSRDALDLRQSPLSLRGARTPSMESRDMRLKQVGFNEVASVFRINTDSPPNQREPSSPNNIGRSTPGMGHSSPNPRELSSPKLSPSSRLEVGQRSPHPRDFSSPKRSPPSGSERDVMLEAETKQPGYLSQNSSDVCSRVK